LGLDKDLFFGQGVAGGGSQPFGQQLGHLGGRGRRADDRAWQQGEGSVAGLDMGGLGNDRWAIVFSPSGVIFGLGRCDTLHYTKDLNLDKSAVILHNNDCICR